MGRWEIGGSTHRRHSPSRTSVRGDRRSFLMSDAVSALRVERQSSFNRENVMNTRSGGIGIIGVIVVVVVILFLVGVIKI